jgi:hypothetical protein
MAEDFDLDNIQKLADALDAGWLVKNPDPASLRGVGSCPYEPEAGP